MDWPRLLLLAFAFCFTAEIRPHTWMVSGINTNSTSMGNYGVMGTTDEEDSEKWGQEQDKLYKDMESKENQMKNTEESGSGSGDENDIKSGNKRQMGNSNTPSGNDTAENIVKEAVNQAIQESKTSPPPMPATLGKTTFPTQPVTHLPPHLVLPQIQQTTEINTIVLPGGDNGTANVASTKVNVTGAMGQNLLVETTQTGAKEDQNKQNNFNMSKPSPGNPSTLNVPGKGSNIDVVGTTDTPPNNNAPQNTSSPAQQEVQPAGPTMNPQPTVPTQPVTSPSQGGQQQTQTQAPPTAAVTPSTPMPSQSQQQAMPTQPATQAAQPQSEQQVQANYFGNLSTEMPTQNELPTLSTQTATNSQITSALFPTSSAPVQISQDNQAQTSQVDNTQAQPAQVDNTQAQPAQVDNTQAQPAQVDNTQAQPAQVDNTQAQPAQVDNTQAQPAQVDNTQAQAAQVDNTQAQPAQVDSTQAQPAQVDNSPSTGYPTQTNTTTSNGQIDINQYAQNIQQPTVSTTAATNTAGANGQYQPTTAAITISKENMVVVSEQPSNANMNTNPAPSNPVHQNTPTQMVSPSDAKKPTGAGSRNNKPNNFDISFHTHVHNPSKSKNTVQIRPLHIGRTVTQSKNGGLIITSSSIYEVGHGFPLTTIDQKALGLTEKPISNTMAKTPVSAPASTPVSTPANASDSKTVPTTQPTTTTSTRSTNEPKLSDTTTIPPPTKPTSSSWMPTYSLLKSVHRNVNSNNGENEPEMNISEMLFPKLPASLPIMIMEDHVTPVPLQQPFLASNVEAPKPVPLMDKGNYQQPTQAPPQAAANPTASTSMFSQGSYPTTMVDNPSSGINLGARLDNQDNAYEKGTSQIEEMSNSPIPESLHIPFTNGLEISDSNEVFFDKKDGQSMNKARKTNNQPAANTTAKPAQEESSKDTNNLPAANTTAKPAQEESSKETKDDVTDAAFKGIEDAVLSVDISELRPGEILSLRLPNSESSQLFKVREIKSSDKVSQYTNDDNSDSAAFNVDKKHLLYAIIEKVKNNKEYRDAMETIFSAADRRSGSSKHDQTMKFPDKAILKNYNTDDIERKTDENFSKFLQDNISSKDADENEASSDTEGSAMQDQNAENAIKKSNVIRPKENSHFHNNHHSKVARKQDGLKSFKKEKKKNAKSAEKSGIKPRKGSHLADSFERQDKFENDIKAVPSLRKTESSHRVKFRKENNVIIEDVSGKVLYRGPMDIIALNKNAVRHNDNRRSFSQEMSEDTKESTSRKGAHYRHKQFPSRIRRSTTDDGDEAKPAKKTEGTFYLTFKLEDNKPNENAGSATINGVPHDKESSAANDQAKELTFSDRLTKDARKEKSKSEEDINGTQKEKEAGDKSKESKTKNKENERHEDKKKGTKERKEQQKERKNDKDTESKNAREENNEGSLLSENKKQNLTHVQIEDDEGNVLYKGPVDIDALNKTISNKDGSYSGFHLEKAGYVLDKPADPKAMEVINNGLQNASPKNLTQGVKVALNRPRRHVKKTLIKDSKRKERKISQRVSAEDNTKVKKSSEAKVQGDNKEILSRDSSATSSKQEQNHPDAKGPDAATSSKQEQKDQENIDLQASESNYQLPSHVIIEDESGNSLYQGPVDILATNKSTPSNGGKSKLQSLKKSFQILKDQNQKLASKGSDPLAAKVTTQSDQNAAQGESAPTEFQVTQDGGAASKGKTITVKHFHTGHGGQKVSVDVVNNGENQEKKTPSTDNTTPSTDSDEDDQENTKSPSLAGLPFFDNKNSKVIHRYVQGKQKTTKTDSSVEPSTQAILDKIIKQVQNRKKENYDVMLTNVQKGASSIGGRIVQGVNKDQSNSADVDKTTQSEYIKNVMQSWLKSKHAGEMPRESKNAPNDKKNKSLNVQDMVESWFKSKKPGILSNKEKDQQRDYQQPDKSLGGEKNQSSNQVMIQNEPNEIMKGQEDKAGYDIGSVKQSATNEKPSQQNAADEVNASVTGDDNIELQTNMANGKVVLTTGKQPKASPIDYVNNDQTGSQNAEPPPIAMTTNNMNSNQITLSNAQNGNQLSAVLSSETPPTSQGASRLGTSYNDVLIQNSPNSNRLQAGLTSQNSVNTVVNNGNTGRGYRILKVSKEKLDELLENSQDSNQEFSPNQQLQDSRKGEPVTLILSNPYLDEAKNERNNQQLPASTLQLDNQPLESNNQRMSAKNTQALQPVLAQTVPGNSQNNMVNQVQQQLNLQSQQMFNDQNTNSTLTPQDKNALLLPNQYYPGDDEKILIGDGGKTVRPEPAAIGAFKSQQSATDLNVLLKMPGSTSPSFLIQSKNMSPLRISSNSPKGQDPSEISVLSGTGQKIECHTLPGQSSLTFLRCGSKAQQQAAAISAFPASQAITNPLNLKQNDAPEQQFSQSQSSEMNFLPSYMLPTDFKMNDDVSHSKTNNNSKLYGFGTVTDPSVYRKATKEIRTYLDKEMNEEKNMIQNLLIDSTSPKASLPAQEEESEGPLVPFGFQYYPGVAENAMYNRETENPGMYQYTENLNTQPEDNALVGGIRGHPPYKAPRRARRRHKLRVTQGSERRLYTRSGPWTHKKSKMSSKKRHPSIQSWFVRRVFGPVQMILPPFYPQPCPWLLSKRCCSCCTNEKNDKEITKFKDKEKEKEKDKEKEKVKDAKYKDDPKSSNKLPDTTPSPDSMSEWEYLGRVMCSCPCCMECVVW